MLGTLQIRAGAESSSYNVARRQKDSEGNIEYTQTSMENKQKQNETIVNTTAEQQKEQPKKKVRMTFQLKTRL